MGPAAAQNSENRVSISVEAYHLLYQQGLIPEKAELIEGVIYSKMPKNPIHSNILRKLNLYLFKILGDKFLLSSENPIFLQLLERLDNVKIFKAGS